LWAPLTFPPDRTADRRTRALTVGGRLAASQSLGAAQAEMDLIGRRLEQQYPETNQDRVVVLRTLSAAFREDSTGPFVAVLQAGALLVLLVACANIAGLLLARGIDRRRELAVRTALGASRFHIVRQFVTETVLLGLLASGLALLFARTGLDVLRSSVPADMSRMIEGWNNLGLDGLLLLLTPALAIGVGLGAGWIPAAAAFRTRLADDLKESDRGAVGGRKRQRARQALVVTEIACALTLLVAAGLSVTAGARMVKQPGGFESANLLRMDIPLPER
jgi:putative ABC transport system permease protein